jgi:TrmH family RNA methyltransferase
MSHPERAAQLITSRDNPLIQRLRKLGQDPGAYRKVGEVWVEGDHLCSACLDRGAQVALAVVADTAWGPGHAGRPSGRGARGAVEAVHHA